MNRWASISLQWKELIIDKHVYSKFHNMHLIIVNTERILCSLADIPPVHGGLVGYRSGSKDVSA